LIIRQRASAICFHNNELLVVRLKDPYSKIEHWFPPGGAVEEGEIPAEAARRETLEETGYKIEICVESELVNNYNYLWNNTNYRVTTHWFAAKLLSLEPVKEVDDADYLIAVGWLKKEQWNIEFSFCREILEAVEKLIPRK